MAPSQMHKFQHYGTVFAFDVQLKFKNKFGWVYVSFSGTNMSNQLDNFFDRLTLQETDGFFVFAVKSVREMSGCSMSSIKIIAFDGKLNEAFVRQELPGKCRCTNWHHFLSMVS